VPLRDDLAGIGRRILDFHEHRGEPPYVLYVYPPSEEWAVRRDLKALQLWLEAPDQGVRCAAISLADLLWQALEAQGWVDELVSQERAAAGNETALHEIYRAVGEILALSPSLPERVIATLDAIGDEPAAVFLYRAGALYPAYRTSTLIDDLRSKLPVPVTLLYPGTIVGEYGLSFMGRTEPAYGYRALIVPRGGRS
jgi:hypothetical protein